MSDKKIVLLSPAHPLRGGIAASSERLARALQAAGHDVVVYSFSLQYPGFLFPGKTQYSDEPPPTDLTIKTCINSINPFNWLRVGYLLTREAPDLVIVRFWLPLMGPCLGSILRLGRWLSTRKMRITGLVDNIIPHEKRPGDRLFARYFIGACDDFVVMSQSVGEEIQQFADKPVRFAPHPVYDNYGEPMAKERARQALRLPQTAPVALFFGFIRQYKGLDLFLESLQYTPHVHALVAGECYEDWSFYQEIINRLGLQERVHVYGDFIPDEQVRVYFSAADLVVQPYRTATQSGISQIACHFEKPVVVTKVGGLPEMVRQGVSGYVVAPEPEAIAGAIRDYFEQKREAAMSAGMREEKKRFGWENLVKAVLGDEK